MQRSDWLKGFETILDYLIEMENFGSGSPWILDLIHGQILIKRFPPTVGIHSHES